MPKFVRKTKRLIIRPLKESDYEAWAKAYSTMHAPLNKWDRRNKSPADLTRAHFKKVLRSQRQLRGQDKFYDLAVFLKSGEMIGHVGIMDILRGIAQTAFLGYTIFNPHWGNGYGKEAALAAVDIGFVDLGLHRLEAGIEPTNRRSILLARSIGLRKEGTKKRAVFLRGEWVDLLVYAATSEEFGIAFKGELKSRPR